MKIMTEFAVDMFLYVIVLSSAVIVAAFVIWLLFIWLPGVIA